MTRFDRSAVHRYAIFTVHREKCYQCGRPLNLLEYQVDHVIPQILGADAVQKLLVEYGRPANFDLQGFENLLPSCAPCNREKNDSTLDSSVLVQRWLQRAADRKPEVLALIERTLRENEIALLLNKIQQHSEAGNLEAMHHDVLQQLSMYHVRVRRPEAGDEPVRLTKNLRIPFTTERSTKQTIITVIGEPTTLGFDSQGAFVRLPVICKKCGGKRFNGTTCVDCGNVN